MPKNTTNSPFLLAYMKMHEDLAIALPHLCALATDPASSFRGLTCFLGDNNSVVIGIKRFGELGKLEILWSSGHDVIAAFMNLEDALASGKWRPDKKAQLWSEK